MTDTPASAKPRNALLEQLCADYTVFRASQPLAIGIHKALQARQPELDKADIRKALHRHTNSTRYLKALTAGAPRYDLDGQADGEVSQEQADQAVSQLRERFKQQTERRKAEQAAQQRQEKMEQLAAKFNQR